MSFPQLRGTNFQISAPQSGEISLSTVSVFEEVTITENVATSGDLFVSVFETVTITEVATVRRRNIFWKGYGWTLRDSTSAGAPGIGTWSASNITDPDGNDYIEIKVTNPTGSAPIGAEMQNTTTGLGYGTYFLTVGTRLDTLDKNLVFGGLFPFYYGTPYIEIDACESSAWGNNVDVKTYYSSWHNTELDPIVTNATPPNFTTTSDSVVTHRLVWSPSQLTFDSYIGSDASGTSIGHGIITTNIPVPATEACIINFWVYGGGTENGYDVPAETSVVLRNFSYGNYYPVDGAYDSIGITEGVTVLVTSFSSASDTVAISENISTSGTLFVSVSDSVSIAESSEGVLVNIISVSDSLTISEDVSLLVTLFASASDEITIGESVSLAVTSFISVSDSISIAENSEGVLVNIISVSDSLTISEDVSLLETSFVSATEDISVAEDATLGVVSFSSVSDSIGVEDSVAAVLVSLASVSENISIAEDVSLLGTLLASVSDSISVSEESTGTLVHFVVVGDAVGVETMIGNGSFEAGSGTTNSNFSCPPWSVTNPAAATVVSITSSSTYDGSQAVKITVDAGNSNNGIAQAATFPVESNTVHVLKVVATSDTAGQLQIQLRDESGNYLQSDGTTWNATPAYYNIDTNTSWSVSTFTFTTGAAQTGVRIADLKRSGISSQAGRTFYIDGVSLNSDREVDVTVTIGASVNDSVTIAEDVATSETSFASVGDDITISESVNVAGFNEYSVSVYDTITIEEFVGYPSELVLITEDTHVLLVSFANTFDEVTISESVSVSSTEISTFTVSVYDTVVVVDFVGYPEDMVYLTDQVFVTLVLDASVSDNTTITDWASALIPTLLVGVSDEVVILETIDQPTSISVAVNDTISVEEEVVLLQQSFVNINDGITISDVSTMGALTREINVSDTVVANEVVATSGQSWVSVFESISCSDIPSPFFVIPLSTYDSVIIGEAITTESIRFSPETSKFKPRGTMTILSGEGGLATSGTSYSGSVGTRI